MCEDDPDKGHHLVMIIIMRSSSGALFSVMSASCPVDIHIYHPSVKDHPHQSQVSQKQRLQPGLLQVISKCPPGIWHLKTRRALSPAWYSYSQKTEVWPWRTTLRLPPALLSFPQKRQNHHGVYLNSLLFIWTSVSSCLPKRDLIILKIEYIHNESGNSCFAFP